MQPAAALGNDGNATVRLIKGISYGGLGSKGTVNEEDFWRKKVQDVPANQLFFHKFFNQRQQRSQHIREKVEKRKGRGDASADEAASDKEAGSPGDSSDSDDQEEEIWQAMKKSMPQKGIADVDSADSEDSKESQGPDESEAEEISGQEQPGHSDSEEGTNSDGPFELAIDDDEDLVGSDADAPDGLLAFGSEGSENNIDWDGAESTVLGKRKKHGKQTAERDDGRKRKKRRLKDLPLFASMEDYEALIDAEPEDNI
ncbi:hypothetical protein FRC19_002611 [Serendipita sp. 401]|nr:hypothetical protein FRC19_002611 [Serendipita sp. 401]KAG9057940.1 hypothetical protein FS842_002942 [Serendipita sp. 407]